jgi:molybdate transport system substrate-binding protein
VHRFTLIFLIFMAQPTLAGEVHIAVAANFNKTAISINTLFEQQSGHSTKLSTASTGVLHSQISHGAPFDVFLSADTQSPALLEAAGRIQSGTRFCYAVGRLALIGGNGTLEDLGDPQLSLAIANPATAPYGRAALQALEKKGSGKTGEQKLVRANNVVQAYQYWYTGAVDLAMVAQSLDPDSGVPVPQSWYDPLEQEAVLMAAAVNNAAALSYLAFLQSEQVKTLIADAGYGMCQ